MSHETTGARRTIVTVYIGLVLLTVVTVLVVWLLNFLNMFPVVGDVARAIQDVFKEFLTKHK